MTQNKLIPDNIAENVEEMRFELSKPNPIKGFPELHWQGKRPFTATNYYPAQLKEAYGDPVDGWMNRIYWGDNLQVMSHLLKEFRGKVDLIYIDPPFDSKADYKKTVSLKGKNAENDRTSFEEKQYTDIWNNDEYLQFIYERLILLKELLSDSGVVIVHLDWHKSHHLRCLLDEIFGPMNFINEIVWHYYNKMQGNINRFASNHDTILVYKKNSNFIYNKIREIRDEPVQQIKRVWDKNTKKLVNAKNENGNVIYTESTERTIDDVWRMSMLQPADTKEPVGYPTQKPEQVISRFILAYSNPNSIVFDGFMGSGTTQAVAMKLGRRFIGADINLGAIQTTTKRLLGIMGEKKKTRRTLLDNEPTPILNFQVYNVNHYDVFRNPAQAKDLLLQALEIEPLESPVMGGLFDGVKDGYLVKVMPINRIATRADLSPIIQNISYGGLNKKIENNPNSTAARIMLVCMGHEPDLAATLKIEVGKQYNIDVQVVDILRDRQDITFKHDSEAEIVIENGKLIIKQFYPRNLLQKLSILEENVEDWRELTESIFIDWNYNGEILQPKTLDIPSKKELVSGIYDMPGDYGLIRVKITDLLSEHLEQTVEE